MVGVDWDVLKGGTITVNLFQEIIFKICVALYSADIHPNISVHGYLLPCSIKVAIEYTF